MSSDITTIMAPHGRLPLALHRAAEVRELDRIAIEDHCIAGYTLMGRAGAAGFRVMRDRWPRARRIAVVCGLGNNGGDGYIVARLAREAGLKVELMYVGDAARLQGDAHRARADFEAGGGKPREFDPDRLGTAQVIVDAVFGTGLEREVTGPWRDAIGAINTSSVGVLAMDIPSGLQADTGAVLGAAVRADVTVSFIGLKRGMFTGAGPEHCGTIEFDALQVPKEVYMHTTASALRISHDILARLLWRRPRTAHKGDHGHVLVVGGDYGMAGAARMAGEAAARVGAGLVSMASRPGHAGAVSGARPELMCHGVETGRDLAGLLGRATVVAVGPGLGRSPWAAQLLGALLDSRLPLVVDADALNLLALEPVARGNWVLTPHPGEAARLLGCTAAEVQADRFAAAQAISGRFDAVCVLKGAGTLVHSGEGPVHVCDAGNPGMGSGGMGDILTGVIAGLAAQGLDMEDASRAGVYAHSAAADCAAADGERGLLATDLLPHLRHLVNPGRA